METPIIVAIVTGVFGSIVTPVVVLLIEKFKTHPAGAPKTRSPARLYLPAGLGGLLGVLLGYFAISPALVSDCPLFAPTSVTIIAPLPEARVERVTTLQGTACHIPAGQELWVLVLPDGTTAYHPQNGPVLVSADGAWAASAYIGRDLPEDVGLGYVVLAGLADSQGSTALKAYMNNAPTTGFVGLEPLPVGIQVVGQLHLIRK